MKNLTFTQALEGYYIFAQSRLSKNTLQDYANTFRKFQDFLGVDLEMNQNDAAQIEAFLNSFRHLKKKTLLNYHTGLSALWTWAYDRKIVAVGRILQLNPAFCMPEKLMVQSYSGLAFWMTG